MHKHTIERLFINAPSIFLQVSIVNEDMLILLGDLMAVLASNDSTRKLVLYQPPPDASNE